MTGMRRNEVLGLKWDDIDFKKKTISLNRGLVAVGYEVHQTRGKTRNARRPIDLDATTFAVSPDGKHTRPPSSRRSGFTTPDGCSPTATANRSTPTPCPRPSSESPAAPGSRSSACMTCAAPMAPSSSRKAIPR
jgi:hypothetical protein